MYVAFSILFLSVISYSFRIGLDSNDPDEESLQGSLDELEIHSRVGRHHCLPGDYCVGQAVGSRMEGLI